MGACKQQGLRREQLPPAAAATRIYNFIPYLSGLFGLYTLKAKRPLQAIDPSSKDRCFLGIYMTLYLFVKYSITFLIFTNLSVLSEGMIYYYGYADTYQFGHTSLKSYTNL